MKTWKASADPDYAAKKARVDHLYAIADGEAAAGPGDPDVAFVRGPMPTPRLCRGSPLSILTGVMTRGFLVV